MNLKPFNVNEYCSWITSQYSPHNCIIVGAVNETIDVDRLQKCVDMAVDNQLQCHYSISRDVCGFIPISPQINVRKISNNVQWQTIAENELGTSFLDGETLVRVTVLSTSESQYIIICFHHIIGDGISGVDFLKQLLHYYNHPNQACGFNDEKITLPVPVQKVMPASKIVVNGKTKIKTIRVDYELAQSIKIFSKQNKLTLNACLSDFILRSASSVFHADAFNVSMPVNLRKKHKNNFLNALKFDTSWIDFLWERGVTNIQSAIKGQLIKQSQKNNLIVLNKLLNDSESHADILINQNPMCQICISNVGSCVNSCCNNDSLKLTELHLSVNCEHYHKTRNSFTIQLSELIDHGLFINVNYCDAHVSDSEVNLFAQNFENALRELKCQSI